MIDKNSGSTPLCILQRIQGGPNSKVWTPRDFLDLGYYDAVKIANKRYSKKTILKLGGND
jgi:hypothetical protein